MTHDINTTLTERGKRYGTFKDHAQISQGLKNAIYCPMSIEKIDALAADQKEALDMIAHKLARIINGDSDYADSWHDIAGYAQLVADRLNGTER